MSVTAAKNALEKAKRAFVKAGIISEAAVALYEMSKSKGTHELAKKAAQMGWRKCQELIKAETAYAVARSQK